MPFCSFSNAFYQLMKIYISQFVGNRVLSEIERGQNV